MKAAPILLILIANVTFANQVLADTKQGINTHIVNQQAKLLYMTMTNVPEDNTAGHSFKTSQNIRCWRVNADIDDAQGHLIPNEDARRYACSLFIDNNGLATPGDRFQLNYFYNK